MRVKHKFYPAVQGRILQFVVRGSHTFAVILLDYREPWRDGQQKGAERFCSYDIADLIPDPPDYKMGL